jgi:acyl-CoA dehydrogenase
MKEQAAPSSPFYSEEHEAFRRSIRRFVEKEIEPYATQWDEAGEFPRELYLKAGEIGYLGLGYPAALIIGVTTAIAAL